MNKLTLARLSSLVALSAVAATAATASAQPAAAPYAAPPAPPAQRDGFLVGFSIGAGSMFAEDESLNGVAFDFSIGGMLNPKLAIMYDASAVMHPEDVGNGESYVFTSSFNTIALQSWVAPKVWLKGGLGFARVFVSGDGESETLENALGITGAAGYEIVQSRNFALDASVRLASGFYEGVTLHNASLLVGFHWY
jgi:hypothetical protein